MSDLGGSLQTKICLTLSKSFNLLMESTSETASDSALQGNLWFRDKGNIQDQIQKFVVCHTQLNHPRN